MSLCAIYTGFLYNEFYAIPMNFYSSSWTLQPDGSSQWSGRAFAFGVDPAWKMSGNELQFYNSLKMKLSIILAYFHMMLGIIMHGVNSVHFRRPYDFFFEFIPRVLFLSCLIGYMVLLIFWKWLTTTSIAAAAQGTTGTDDLPYIIGVMINMFLSPLSYDHPELCRNMLGCSVQIPLEFVLLAVALICVPVMLLAKPLLLRRDVLNGNVHPDFKHHPFEFSELMVHQVIETIEFVLGSVSNTASYLRLWALSLAHSELSIVFYEKALGMAMGVAAEQGGGMGTLLMFVGWGLWASFTVFVLLGMESLSSFLHTLRLHWVEFQNKFYNLHGSGVKFTPFSLKKVMKEGRKNAVQMVEAE
jgi:V-type H+-transporting ATPase subunit a